MPRRTVVVLAALGLSLTGSLGLAAGGRTIAFADAPPGAVSAGAPAPEAAPQPTSGAFTVGPSGKEVGQSQSTQLSNAQQVDPTAGSIVGGVQQANGQQSATHQAVDQTQSGTFVVFGGGLHQRANQLAGTTLANDQLVDGGTVIGQVGQDNLQSADINQAIRQSLAGTFVVFGGTQTVDPGAAKSFADIAKCDLCADALSDAAIGLVAGNLRQREGSRQSKAGLYVVLGSVEQSFSQNQNVDEVNDQTVNGSMIIGDTSQKNAQHANVNQGIDQSLTGTYVVFGTLDQSANQVALISESNHQKIQGG